MRKFCKDVLDFLQSEYNDSYRFEVHIWTAVPAHLMPNNNEKAELVISYTNQYKLILNENSMRYLFGLYCSGEFIEERCRYLWQKELIDMIEGG